MVDYVSEAEALSEIYDDAEVSFKDDFKTYSKNERRDYIDAKSKTFKESDIGKWVVTQKPKYKKGIVSILYLVNRNLTKRFWWSPDSSYAMVFEKESAAKIQAAKYRFNKANVRRITLGMANKRWFSLRYENQ